MVVPIAIHAKWTTNPAEHPKARDAQTEVHADAKTSAETPPSLTSSDPVARPVSARQFLPEAKVVSRPPRRLDSSLNPPPESKLVSRPEAQPEPQSVAPNTTPAAVRTALGGPPDLSSKSVVEIIIFDDVSGSPVKTGSGISIGGSSILTNYHVAAELITHPYRYTAIVCVPDTLTADPICDYSASANEKFNLPSDPLFDASLDFAIINVNWQYDGHSWTRILDVPETKSFLSLASTPVNPELGIRVVDIGDEVTTFGFPDYGGGRLMTSRGSIKEYTTENGIVLLGTDAKIGHGSSGGGAFDKDGKLMGITSGGTFDAAGNFLEGFIIPISTYSLWQKDLLNRAVTANVTQTDTPTRPMKSPLAYVKLLQRTFQIANEGHERQGP